MTRALPIEEVAERVAIPAAQLRRWMAQGLLGAEFVGEHRWRQVARVRAVQFLLQHNVSEENLAGAMTGGQFGAFLERYLDAYFPEDHAASSSVPEVAQTLGLPLAIVQRLCDLAGLTERGDLDAEDVRMLGACKVALDHISEDALLQLARVYADALGRVAEAESRQFHFDVHERLRNEGVPAAERWRLTQTGGDRLRALVGPTILYFHRRAQERAEREDLLLHLADEIRLHGPRDAPGQLHAAILFVDLASFTSLTEAMGDVAAAEVLARFGTLVREVAGRWRGRVVKQIGDAFMLLFFEPRLAVACALEIDVRAAVEPLFPAVRSGLHWGPVLYREGDYVGATVNLAARIAAAADRHQVLVTMAVREQVHVMAEVQLVRLGTRQLKGLPEAVELFAVYSRTGKAAPRARDPVCGMGLGPDEIAARLTLEDEELAFCSERCLQRFVAAPASFRHPTVT